MATVTWDASRRERVLYRCAYWLGVFMLLNGAFTGTSALLFLAGTENYPRVAADGLEGGGWEEASDHTEYFVAGGALVFVLGGLALHRFGARGLLSWERRSAARPACAGCARTNEPGARFCQGCGRAL